MAQNFTRENVTAALKDIVAEYGEDYVYPAAGATCTYSQPEDGKLVPSCIVGHVIYRLAPEAFAVIADLEAITNFGDSSPAQEVLRGALGDFGVQDNSAHLDPLTEDRDLVYALTEAQGAQDTGHTWGQALEAYLDEL